VRRCDRQPDCAEAEDEQGCGKYKEVGVTCSQAGEMVNNHKAHTNKVVNFCVYTGFNCTISCFFLLLLLLFALQPTMRFSLLSDSPPFRPFLTQLSPLFYS